MNYHTRSIKWIERQQTGSDRSKSPNPKRRRGEKHGSVRKTSIDMRKKTEVELCQKVAFLSGAAKKMWLPRGVYHGRAVPKARGGVNHAKSGSQTGYLRSFIHHASSHPFWRTALDRAAPPRCHRRRGNACPGRREGPCGRGWLQPKGSHPHSQGNGRGGS